MTKLSTGLIATLSVVLAVSAALSVSAFAQTQGANPPTINRFTIREAGR
jgi:polar amino acid transport system substrate-binding protein